MELTSDPQLNAQILAALKFWRIIAEQSRQHPSRHTGVAEMFKHFSPMTIREIDEVLDGTYVPEPEYLSIPQAADSWGLNPSTLRAQIKAGTFKPVYGRGSQRFYRLRDLKKARARIMDKIAHGASNKPKPKLRRD